MVHELTQIKIRMQAQEKRLDACIEEMERQNKKNFAEPVKTNKFLTIKDVSEMVGLSEYIIREDIKAGAIEFTTHGNRKFITTEEVEKYIQ